MKTKEDILLGYPRYSLVNFAGNIDNEQMYIKDVRKALDEYAKQQAIAFAKWTAENLWTVYGDQWYLYRDEDNPIPADKLYAQFIESQNKGQ